MIAGEGISIRTSGQTLWYCNDKNMGKFLTNSLNISELVLRYLSTSIENKACVDRFTFLTGHYSKSIPVPSYATIFQ